MFVASFFRIVHSLFSSEIKQIVVLLFFQVDSPGDTTLWRLIYTFYCFVAACCSSRISFNSSCFNATLNW